VPSSIVSTILSRIVFYLLQTRSDAPTDIGFEFFLVFAWAALRRHLVRRQYN